MRLILALHHHQPLGQLPWIVADAVRDCYEPLLKVLLRHPSLKIALHYSGPLLEMLTREYPFIIDQIKVLLARGQIELLGGAWWECILPVWPKEDQIAQLQLFQSRLKVLFGAQPQGAWLPERVWEPELAGTLKRAGYHWTLLDDNGLRHAAPPHTMCRSGELNVYPIDAELRRLIPWQPVNETVQYLERLHQHDSTSIAVFADDAEKLGSWPGTYSLVYEEGYLEDLLTALQQNDDWLQTVLPSEYVAENKNGIINFEQIPATSYPEMLEWSGGNWRHFLDRYQESRDMYEAVLRAPQGDERLAAQCNDAYWHGVFGGLYLPHLRQAVYGAVARAESTFSGAAIKTLPSGDVVLRDNSRHLLGWRPRGGQLFQWIDIAKQHNWLATLRRYAQSYGNEQLADWYARGSSIEHFLGNGATPQAIARGHFYEEGDFATEAWQMETHPDSPTSVQLKRNGGVWQNGQFLPLEIRKAISLQENDCHLHYEFINPGAEHLHLWWASEWNVSLSGSDFPERNFQVNGDAWSLHETHVTENVTQWQLNDKWLQSSFCWESDRPCDLWLTPFCTNSRYEGGQDESIFQQSTIAIHQKIALPPGEIFDVKMRVWVVE